MPDKGLSAIEQARLLDTLIEASNEVIDYKRVLHAYSFDETTTTQNGYIFANEDDESAEQFCAHVGSDKLWAVAFVNGDLSMERNYLAACKMTGTIPDDFDKVVILPSGSYVFPAKDTEELHLWIERNGFFIVYYFDYSKDECEVDVLADVGPYSIYSQMGPYKDVVYIDSIDPQKADMSIPNQDINIMLDSMLECIEVDEPHWVKDVKYLSEITGIWTERLGQFGLEVAFATYPEEMEEGKDGLRKIGRFLGIDDDLETFKHGVPREDIIA